MTPEAGAPARPAAPGWRCPELLEAVRRIAVTDHLLVAMDFDGTISPIVDHAGTHARSPARLPPSPN